MHNEELKFPEWQKPVQELILEFDRSKLPGKLQQVEAQILRGYSSYAGGMTAMLKHKL